MKHNRANFTLGLAILMCLLLTVPLNAQTVGATISGTVADPSGAVIPNARVTATNGATGISHATVTNASGSYSIPNLQPGQYAITAAAEGFPQYVAKDVVLEVGAQQQLNFTLRMGGVEQRVDVTGAAPSVDLVSSTVKPVVDSKTIVELPLNGRDWTQLADLQPGVAPMRSQPVVTVSNQRANRGVGAQITISGARPQENNYRVDGISINDYSNGGPGGVIGANLGVDAIQEFSVVTSNAAADTGKTAGGVINAVTREGSNKFHGNVYEFLRNSALDARNEFDQPGHIAPFRRNQFGASVGGPIIKDRTFFFADYEGLRQYQSTNVSSIVPSAAARQGHLSSGTVTVDPKVQPYLNFYPLPNTPTTGDTGTFLFNAPQTTNENYFTVRGDHKISESDSLSGTYFLDRGTLEAPDPFDVKNLGNLDRRYLATLNETHVFNPRLLNSARFGYSRVVSIAPSTINSISSAAGDTSLGFVPGHAVGLINIGGISNFTGGLGAVGQYSFHYNSYQAYDDVNWTPGKHTISFGFAFERLQNNQLGLVYPNGFFTFNNLAAFLTNQPSTFTAQLSQFITPRDLRQSVFGAYFVDNYHLLPNLTLNLGLRYEPSSVPTETAGRLAALRSLTDTQPHLGSPYFSNPTLWNFAPRVGFSWDPFGTGKTAIRGGFGVYDALPLNYLFEGLSILTAPYTEQISTGTLSQGTFPTLAFSQLANATNLRYSYVQPNPPRNYVEQWNLNIQRDLGWNFTLQTGYYGSHGVHLPYREDDINTVQPASTSGGYFFPTPRGSGTRLNPALGQISSLLWVGGSNYNALQTQITKRLSHRIQLQGSYTYGKSIDDGSSSTFGDTFTNSVSSLPSWAPARRRAISDFDVTHNVVINYLYELPSPQSGALWAFKGWQWAGIFQASSGLPFSPLVSGDALGLNSADVFDFADFIGGSGCSGNPVNPQNRFSYIKTQCFAFPNPGTRLGNAGRNSLRGPGLQDFDTSLIKNTHVPRISENFVVQFRAEMFNVANRVNYGTPLKASTFLFSQTGAPIASAGQLTQTSTSSRQVQFAIKVLF